MKNCGKFFSEIVIAFKKDQAKKKTYKRIQYTFGETAS
jgi:hypothetical protein